MLKLHLDVKLPADEFLRVYQGTASRVWLRSREGKSVSLPAGRLQPFLTREGVYGSFELTFDDQGKFISLRRLA
jgi:hypothetical protein